MSTHRPGVNKTFDEYYESLEPIREGCIEERSYKIYRIPHSNGEPSHYTAYVQLPELCICRITSNSFPPVPVTYQLNFGPTEDNWVGFGTAEPTDYNYDRYHQPLSGDSRISDLPFAEEPRHWTPSSLETALEEWVETIVEELSNEECPYCSTDSEG